MGLLLASFRASKALRLPMLQALTQVRSLCLFTSPFVSQKDV
jgi:hypothetical protein